MQQDFFVGRVPQGRILAWVVAVAAVLLVPTGLASAPAGAQGTNDVVVDLVVTVDQGQCGTGNCAQGETPVTFDATLTVNEAETQINGRSLTPQQAAAVNAALEAQGVEITLTDAAGTAQTVDEGTAICLEPGQYTVAAAPVDADAAIQAVVVALADEGIPIVADDVTIGEFTDTFRVARCPAEDGGGGGDGGEGGGGGNVSAAEAQYKDKIINIPD